MSVETTLSTAREEGVRATLHELHPAFGAAAAAAMGALDTVLVSHTRAELERSMGVGADGTTTMWVDTVVEEAIVEAVAALGVNVLSEEIGFVDQGSAYTLVVDPVDGSANAAAGIPLACFSAALAIDTRFVESATVWLATGRAWAGSADGRVVIGGPWATTGRRQLDGAAVSLLRPRPHTREHWWRVAERAARVRILSCTTLEAMLVLQGSTDAFADAGSDTHRLVDLAAAAVLLPTVGGVVIDARGRPVEFDLDLHRRWSGVVAATPQLADELIAAILGSPAQGPCEGASTQTACDTPRSADASACAVDAADHRRVVDDLHPDEIGATADGKTSPIVESNRFSRTGRDERDGVTEAHHPCVGEYERSVQQRVRRVVARDDVEQTSASEMGCRDVARM